MSDKDWNYTDDPPLRLGDATNDELKDMQKKADAEQVAQQIADMQRKASTAAEIAEMEDKAAAVERAKLLGGAVTEKEVGGETPAKPTNHEGRSDAEWAEVEKYERREKLEGVRIKEDKERQQQKSGAP